MNAFSVHRPGSCPGGDGQHLDPGENEPSEGCGSANAIVSCTQSGAGCLVEFIVSVQPSWSSATVVVAANTLGDTRSPSLWRCVQLLFLPSLYSSVHSHRHPFLVCHRLSGDGSFVMERDDPMMPPDQPWLRLRTDMKGGEEKWWEETKVHIFSALFAVSAETIARSYRCGWTSREQRSHVEVSVSRTAYAAQSAFSR